VTAGLPSEADARSEHADLHRVIRVGIALSAFWPAFDNSPSIAAQDACCRFGFGAVIVSRSSTPSRVPVVSPGATLIP